ncbi:MAG: hypothetical protein WC683_04390 [bacterium]
MTQQIQWPPCPLAGGPNRYAVITDDRGREIVTRSCRLPGAGEKFVEHCQACPAPELVSVAELLDIRDYPTARSALAKIAAMEEGP